MLDREHRLRRNGVELLGDGPCDGGDGADRKLLVGDAQTRVLPCRRRKRLARPCAAGLGVEVSNARLAPAAVKRAARSRVVVVDAEVVVDPDARRVVSGVDTRHRAHVGEEARIARTAAVLVLHARGAGPARPVAARIVVARAERPAVPDRGLYLEAGFPAERGDVLRRPSDPRRVFAVLLQRRHAEARAEPDLVAERGAFLEHPERLRPRLVAFSMASLDPELQHGPPGRRHIISAMHAKDCTKRSRYSNNLYATHHRLLALHFRSPFVFRFAINPDAVHQITKIPFEEGGQTCTAPRGSSPEAHPTSRDAPPLS